MRSSLGLVLTLAVPTVVALASSTTAFAEQTSAEMGTEAAPSPAVDAGADWLRADLRPARRHGTNRTGLALVITGTAVAVTSYAVTVFGGVISAASQDGCLGPPNPSIGCYRVRSDLMVPVLGPIIDVAHSGNPGGAYTFDVLDGLAQVGGIAMVAVGVAWGDEGTTRAGGVSLAPIAAPGVRGMGVVGTF